MGKEIEKHDSSDKQSTWVELELEGVWHLNALLRHPEAREEIEYIIKEWVQDGNLTINSEVDTM